MSDSTAPAFRGGFVSRQDFPQVMRGKCRWGGMETPKVTARALYDSATAAGLKLDSPRGLYPCDWGDGVEDGHGCATSLADVVLAVMTALATCNPPHRPRPGIFVRPVYVQWHYGNPSGRDGWQAFDASGIGDYGGEELCGFTEVCDSLPDCLLAACEALRKGAA